jgi:hypothetical protein
LSKFWAIFQYKKKKKKRKTVFVAVVSSSGATGDGSSLVEKPTDRFRVEWRMISCIALFKTTCRSLRSVLVESIDKDSVFLVL